MAPVQPVGHAQNGCQLGDREIVPAAKRAVPAHQVIIIEFQMVILDHIGNNLPLHMRQADDLRGHDDIIGTFSQIDQTDILAAVVQQRCDPQKKPLPPAQSVYLLHAVEDGERDLLQCLASALTAHIALADVLRAGHDILLKIMAFLEDLVLFSVFIGDAVTETYARRPDQSGIHHLDDPVEQHTGYEQ